MKKMSVIYLLNCSHSVKDFRFIIQSIRCQIVHHCISMTILSNVLLHVVSILKRSMTRMRSMKEKQNLTPLAFISSFLFFVKKNKVNKVLTATNNSEEEDSKNFKKGCYNKSDTFRQCYNKFCQSIQQKYAHLFTQTEVEYEL